MQPTQPPRASGSDEHPIAEEGAAAPHNAASAPVSAEAAATVPVTPPDAPPTEATTLLTPPSVAFPPPGTQSVPVPEADLYDHYAPFEPPSTEPQDSGFIGRLSGPIPQVAPGPSLSPYATADTAAVLQPAATPKRRGVMLAVLGVLGASTLIAGLVGGLGYLGRSMAAKDQFSFALFTVDGLRYWLPAVALALIAGLIVLLVAGRRSLPGLVPGTAWLFPAVAVLSGALVLSIYHDRSWWYVAPVVTWIVLIIGTIARIFLREPAGAGHDIARTALTVVSYVVAFLALAMIYINKLRSIYSATAVTLVCILLLLQMTDGEPAPLSRRLVYAITGGLIIGQVTWVINYWSAAGWTGGAFLLAVFYLIAGLTAAQLRDHIGLFDVIEFGGVALLAMAIVSAAVLYQT